MVKPDEGSCHCGCCHVYDVSLMVRAASYHGRLSSCPARLGTVKDDSETGVASSSVWRRSCFLHCCLHVCCLFEEASMLKRWREGSCKAQYVATFSWRESVAVPCGVNDISNRVVSTPASHQCGFTSTRNDIVVTLSFPGSDCTGIAAGRILCLSSQDKEAGVVDTCRPGYGYIPEKCSLGLWRFSWSWRRIRISRLPRLPEAPSRPRL